jgi:hypothetical protein
MKPNAWTDFLLALCVQEIVWNIGTWVKYTVEINFDYGMKTTVESCLYKIHGKK